MNAHCWVIVLCSQVMSYVCSFISVGLLMSNLLLPFYFWRKQNLTNTEPDIFKSAQRIWTPSRIQIFKATLKKKISVWIFFSGNKSEFRPYKEIQENQEVGKSKVVTIILNTLVLQKTFNMHISLNIWRERSCYWEMQHICGLKKGGSVNLLPYSSVLYHF